MVAEPDQRIDAGLQHLESLSGTESEHPPDEGDVDPIIRWGITIETIGIGRGVRRAHEASIARPRIAITWFVEAHGVARRTLPGADPSGARSDRP